MVTGDDPILTLIIFVLTSAVIGLTRLWDSDGTPRLTRTARNIIFFAICYLIFVMLVIMILIIYVTLTRHTW
jgi:predicted membrane protein